MRVHDQHLIEPQARKLLDEEQHRAFGAAEARGVREVQNGAGGAPRVHRAIPCVSSNSVYEAVSRAP